MEEEINGRKKSKEIKKENEKKQRKKGKNE